jgi:hypothetical protein
MRERRHIMFGSQILEVAIGIVFVYLLLSLICSTANELVARMSALRSGTLEAGIHNLLSGKTPSGQELTDIFYEHPLIKGLYKQGWFDKLVGRKGKPSYIPSSTFALTLFDIFAPTDAAGPRALSDVRNAVVNLPDSETRNTLLFLIDEAEGDLKKARENVEQWFNNAMERVSGWYKRNIQLITLGVAFIISAGLNADTFIIANSFYRDPTVRASVVSSAQEAAKQPLSAESEQSLARMSQTLQQLQLPMGWSDPRMIPSKSIGWITKFFGLLFTTLAISLGAPFWFDLLGKIIRPTGKQEKTPEK